MGSLIALFQTYIYNCMRMTPKALIDIHNRQPTDIDGFV